MPSGVNVIYMLFTMYMKACRTLNKLARRWLLKGEHIVIIVFRTVYPTTIGASDQDYPMSTGGGKTEVERKEKIFSGTQLLTLF